MREEARRLRLEGKSRSQIARALRLKENNTSLQRWVGDLPRPEWTLRPTAKDELRARAIELRKQGLSYREIAAATGASKGTLSLWLHEVEITEEQRVRLRARMVDPEMRRKGWAASSAKRAELRKRVAAQAQQEIGIVPERELFIAGIVAYWAEGTKAKPWRPTPTVTFVNSDPKMIRLFLAWLDLIGVSTDRLTFRLQIHESADVAEAEEFWATVVGVPAASFKRVTLKRHNPKTVRKNVGRSYRGCLTIAVRKPEYLYHRIAGWFEGIMDGCGGSANGKPRDLGSRYRGSNPLPPAGKQATLFERPVSYLVRRAS